MRDDVRNAFLAFTSSFESYVDWLYLDVKGFVSIGAGNLVDPPSLMKGLQFTINGRDATPSEVSCAWLKVKNLQSMAKMGGGAFKEVTSIRATKDSIDSIIMTKLRLNETILKQAFPKWEDWPYGAQMVVLSMAWAYGAAFTPQWPRFSAACTRGDWLVASKQASAGPQELAKQNLSFKRRNATNVALMLHASKSMDEISIEEALIEGVNDGVITATLNGIILSPEEHEAQVNNPNIIYSVSN